MRADSGDEVGCDGVYRESVRVMGGCEGVRREFGDGVRGSWVKVGCVEGCGVMLEGVSLVRGDK